MEILGVLLAFVGFALGIYEIINTLRGKGNKRVLCGVAIAYLGYGVFNSVSQKDLRHFGIAFLFGLIFYAIRVLCVFLRMVVKHEKRSLRKNLIVVAVLLVGFIAGMMLATVYKGNIIKNLIMDCQSYTKYRPNETTGGIFVSWRRKEELPTGA